MQRRNRFRKDWLPDPAVYYTEQLSIKPRSKWVTTKCVFHDDGNPSFSVNIINGAYCCHACGEKGGDVLAFHRARYGLDFVGAAKELGAWE